jgi:hypothetical protein
MNWVDKPPYIRKAKRANNMIKDWAHSLAIVDEDDVESDDERYVIPSTSTV